MLRTHGKKVGIATTRIYKPGELGHLKVIERLHPDVILVRNLGALQYFQSSTSTLHGDFSLNVSNSLSADWFFSKGLKTITPSYDLNGEQLFGLLGEYPSADSAFEVVLHQYMPGFHMEHCVFAAFLSNGTSFRDCGKPCEKHRVELKDPKGELHPLKPDAECRNTMFKGRAQTAVRLLPKMLQAGVTRFRLEALFETPSELRVKVESYLSVLEQAGTGEAISISDQVLKTLGAVERFGVTEGQLFNINTYRDRRKGGGAAVLA